MSTCPDDPIASDPLSEMHARGWFATSGQQAAADAAETVSVFVDGDEEPHVLQVHVPRFVDPVEQRGDRSIESSDDIDREIVHILDTLQPPIPRASVTLDSEAQYCFAYFAREDDAHAVAEVLRKWIAQADE